MARFLRILGFVVLCLAGAGGGAVVGGRAQAEIGPFRTTVLLRPAITGDTLVRLAPLGTLRLDTHDGLFGITASADEVDVAAARRLAESPGSLNDIDDEVVDDAKDAVRTVVGRGAAGAVLGALLVATLRRPTPRALVAAVVVATMATTAAAATARVTWNDAALAEPRYTGLLTVAPQAIGSIERVREQYTAYRSQLASLVGNMAELYNAAAGLTSFEPSADTIRLLHVSDLHLNPQAFDLIAQLVRQFRIDVVVDSGDINDWGTAFEATFVDRIGTLAVPYVYVRGNHDSVTTTAAVAAQPNAVVLDGEVREVAGIRFWGIGDPRFTPDKTDELDADEEREVADRFAPEVARQLRRVAPVDAVVVHDPRIAAEVGGLTSLVLAGHAHRPMSRQLSATTLLLVEGSTGGAGLRTLEKGEPVPLRCSVLYFERADHSLRALDRVTVAGLGNAAAHIERRVVSTRRDGNSAAEQAPGESGAPSSATRGPALAAWPVVE